MPSDVGLTSGATVSVAMADGLRLTGEVVSVTPDVLQLRLTQSAGPYVAGEVAEINTVG